MKFPIVSSCSQCQALSDGRKIFELAEQAAARENLTVDRFLGGMREALAIAETISAALDCDTFEDLTGDQLATVANSAAAELARAIIARDPSLSSGHARH